MMLANQSQIQYVRIPILLTIFFLSLSNSIIKANLEESEKQKPKIKVKLLRRLKMFHSINLDAYCNIVRQWKIEIVTNYDDLTGVGADNAFTFKNFFITSFHFIFFSASSHFILRGIYLTEELHEMRKARVIDVWQKKQFANSRKSSKLCKF